MKQLSSWTNRCSASVSRDWFTQMASSNRALRPFQTTHHLVAGDDANGRNVIVASKQQKTYELLVQMFTGRIFDFVKSTKASAHARQAAVDRRALCALAQPIFLT